jgi:hypothetical protein
MMRITRSIQTLKICTHNSSETHQNFFARPCRPKRHSRAAACAAGLQPPLTGPDMRGTVGRKLKGFGHGG